MSELADMKYDHARAYVRYCEPGGYAQSALDSDSDWDAWHTCAIEGINVALAVNTKPTRINELHRVRRALQSEIEGRFVEHKNMAMRKGFVFVRRPHSSVPVIE